MEIPKTDLSWSGMLSNLFQVYLDASSSVPVSFQKLKKLRSAILFSKFLPSIENFEQLERVDFLELHSPSNGDLSRLGGATKNLRVFGPPSTWSLIDRSRRIKRLTILFAGQQTHDIANIGQIENLRTLPFSGERHLC